MIFPRKLLFAIKSIGLLTIFSLFWIQIKFESSSDNSQPSASSSSSSNIYTLLQLTDSDLAKFPSSISPFDNLNQLADFIKLNNEVQFIHNLDKFGQINHEHLYYRNNSQFKFASSSVDASPSSSPDVTNINPSDLNLNKSTHHSVPEPFIVIVVQVHTRAKYLLNLINSLRVTRGIENVLLVFSHDFYHEKFNSEIKSIDFCRYTRIYYPHSIQLYPLTFPGTDPRDCPRNLDKLRAQKLNCSNANYPDTYGHYREAKYTQAKHHWVWKGNFVINQLRVLNQLPPNLGDDLWVKRQILYLFLEEDHIVAPDILHVLKLLNSLRVRKCKVCEILNLGNYVKNANFANNGNKFEVNKWFALNMGIVFEKHSWNRLVVNSGPFCTFDDYNWDWSMKLVSDRYLDKNLRSLVIAAPRVFHVGECGMHLKGKSCNQLTMTRKATEIIESSKKYLFPSSLVQHAGGRKSSKPPPPNGGWSDPRDHQLCLYLFNSSFSSPIVTSSLPPSTVTPIDMLTLTTSGSSSIL